MTKVTSKIHGTSQNACEREYGMASYMNEVRSRYATVRSLTRTGMTEFMKIIPAKMDVMKMTPTIAWTPVSSDASKSK